MIASDEIVRVEEFKIERFEALGLGRYDAIKAVDAGIDWHTVEGLVNEKRCPLAVALEVTRRREGLAAAAPPRRRSLFG